MFNKKGLSEIIAYVILIVIAISLSLLVYAWLKGYIIKPEQKCLDDISITLKNYDCYNNKINITFKNTGFFNVEGVIVRVANISRGKAVYFLEKNANENEIYFINENNTLFPNAEYSVELDYSDYNQLTKIEIQPFEKTGLICDNAIIKQDLDGCGGSSSGDEIDIPGTNLIVKKADSGTGNWSDAIRICNNLGGGWYLPSIVELRILYTNKAFIGGFSDISYWSSTEAGDLASYISFSNGFENTMLKVYSNVGIRCVKSS